MTRHPRGGPLDVISAALNDWWLTADFTQPFHPDDVAEHVGTYLKSNGYVIAPDIPAPPPYTRRDTAEIAVLAAISALAALLAAALHDWWWAGFGALGAAVLTVQARRDITARRRHHRSLR